MATWMEEAGFPQPGPQTVDLGHGVRYEWKRCEVVGHAPGEPHTIHCLWVWHDCQQILGPDTVAPGLRKGWSATGVGLHDLIAVEPLHIEASVYWPACCGMHGFIRNGSWRPA
jgi:hypothetical protein